MHLVLLSLCAYRIWRLIGKDDITAGARVHLPGVVLKGVSCAWCLGTWTALALVAYDHFRPIPMWLLAAGSAASVVGFLGLLDDRLSA